MPHDVHAAIYARISQDREGAGLGVERQAKDCHTLARRLGWQVVETFTDNDVSAYSGKPRPGYERMLAGIGAGRITGVLAWHTDRLHRSPVELERYIQTCGEDAGVPTQTVRGGELDLSTPSGRLYARLMGAVARSEAEKLSDRQKAKMAELAQAGKWRGGRRPFGYETDGVTVRSHEADEIAKAYETILAGGSLRGVAADWNSRGVYGTKGGRWTPGTVRQLLLRVRNVGKVGASADDVVADACWSALVSEETFYAVRSIVTDPARLTHRGTQPRWLGSNLYVCSGCEQPDLRVSGPSSRRRMYRCAARTEAAYHVSRQAALLDDYVERVMVERLSRPDAADMLNHAEATDTAALHAEATTLRARLDDLSAAFAEGEVTRSQLSTGTARIRGKLEGVETELAAAAQSSPLIGVAGAGDVAAVWFGTTQDRADGLPLDRRRAIISTLASVIVLPARRGKYELGEFDPESVRIEWRS
jgi:DNA invertase Pin-like site-specific DNA recombinase